MQLLCSEQLLQAVHLSLQLSRHMLLVPGELGDTGHKVVLQLDVRSPQHHEVEVDQVLEHVQLRELQEGLGRGQVEDQHEGGMR